MNKQEKFKQMLIWSYETYRDPEPFIKTEGAYIVLDEETPSTMIRNAMIIAEMLSMTAYIYENKLNISL